MRDETKTAAKETSRNFIRSVPKKKSIAGHVLSSKIGSVRAVCFVLFFFSFSTCKRSSFLRYRSLGVHGLVPVPQVRGAEVRGSADLALKSSRIVDFGDKSSGFADLKNTEDRGSAESFGPVSGFCQSRSSDCGSDHR